MTIDKSTKIKERVVDRMNLKSFRRFFIEKRYNFIFIDLNNVTHNLALDNPKRVNAARMAAKKSANGALPGLESTQNF